MKRILGLVCVCTLGFSVSARADLSYLVARASLVSDHAAISPGTEFILALRLQMPEDAYVYWRNPGDAGLPTQVEWVLPEGFEAGALEWPVPVVFDEGPLRSFGYKGEALLFSRVQAPEAMPDSGTLTFGVKSEWLLCREACVPGDAQVELELDRADEARHDPDGKVLIERYRSKLPEKDAGWQGRFAMGDASISVRLIAPEKDRPASGDEWLFLPSRERVIAPAARQESRRSSEGIALDLQRDVMREDPGRTLEGVLLFRRNERTRRALEVRLTAE